MEVVKRVTKKMGKVVTLPAIKSYMYQPNRVTNACYDYTLIQEKVFNYVMFYLQVYIKRIMNGEIIQQIDMFRQYQDIEVTVPLSAISTPNQYNKVRESAKELASIVVTIKDKNKKMIRYTGLFSEIQVPDKSRSADLHILIRPEVAHMLVNIDKNHEGKCCNYTGYILEIANRSKNKYTSRIYKLISSWKERGGFVMSVEELKELLQLDDRYKNYSDIKKRILLPVMQELKENADCWFDCSDKEFEKKEGHRVVGLSFKVITPKLKENERMHADNIRHLLRTHLGFKDEHLKHLDPIFAGKPDYMQLQYKIIDLHQRVHTDKTIGNPFGYIIKALLNTDY